jgi:outer membrane protein OmpA-like peptidoglycan-associated protein
MQKSPSSAALLLFLFSSISLGQTENYFIRKASFSSEKYDEFSPVFFRKGIVFCSNKNTGLLSGYSTSNNKGFFKINYIDTAGNPQWQQSKLLPGDVNSHFNNGPATFSPAGDTIYFSRNLIVDGSYRDVTGPGNKLGLFYAVLKNGEWTGVTEMRFNDNSYNVTTPYLSPDGKTLFFASDKPEGYGGADLYSSKWKDGYWDNPVNLGHRINTGGNEAYPFINGSGELFFSSDSLPGKGGKDIFYSRYVDTAWIKPVGLNAPVNSSRDDFGFIADNVTGKGYFTSNRNNMLDIYSFRTLLPQFFYCMEQRDDQHCLSLSDDASIDIDPINLQYQWDFGDGKKLSGYVVNHCFSGPGKYIVTQNIVERKSGKIVFNKMTVEVQIKESDLPYIQSEDTTVKGVPVSLMSGGEVNGYETLSYIWDLGNKVPQRGKSVSYSFPEKGKYPVKLLINRKEKSSGKLSQVCVVKEIFVKSSLNEKVIRDDSANTLGGLDKIADVRNASVLRKYSARDALSNKAVFHVQIMTSPAKIPPENSRFDNISPEYNLRSIRLDDNTYSYIIDEEPDFMSAYPAFKDAVSRGYKDAKIVTWIPVDAGERDLWNFKRTYGSSADLFFTRNGFSILAKGTTILDQLVLLLKRNPGMKILIAVHTDDTGLQTNNLMVSRRQGTSILDYLVSKGIEKERLSATGYGSSRPIAQNYPESERRKNNRVTFLKYD